MTKNVDYSFISRFVLIRVWPSTTNPGVWLESGKQARPDKESLVFS